MTQNFIKKNYSKLMNGPQLLNLALWLLICLRNKLDLFRLKTAKLNSFLNVFECSFQKRGIPKKSNLPKYFKLPF